MCIKHERGWLSERVVEGDASERSGKYVLARSGLLARLAAVLTGTVALGWLLIRSGSKPTRLSYPCQQASLGSALTLFGAPLAAAVSWRRNRFSQRRRAIGVPMVLASAAVVFALWLTSDLSRVQPNIIILAPPEDYSPEVFAVNSARGPTSGRFGGIDDLATLMGTRGFKWHASQVVGPTSGPDGMIDADDAVLIKVNAQWPERGGTNTDVLRGVIRQIVEHPDGFLGEVVVADNGQGRGKLDWADSNAEDITQSARDVIDEFVSEGWRVSGLLWDDLVSEVEEYSAGDVNDGYLVAGAADAETNIRVSYPKFQTSYGTRISYKYGVWSEREEVYDADKLVVINVPVLKTHRIYGVTGGVKNHMGVVSQRIATESHGCVASGGLGTVLAEVRMPDLTILDCIWIMAHPGSGPNAPYTSASRRDRLVASTDPVALDAWAVKHILIPQITENGYAHDDYHEEQDMDNPESIFRLYLDRSMTEMLAAGIQTTSAYSAVSANTWTGDEDRDGDVDLADLSAYPSCQTGPIGHRDASCFAFDPNDDGTVDLRDFGAFQITFTGSF